MMLSSLRKIFKSRKQYLKKKMYKSDAAIDYRVGEKQEIFSLQN